jgi:hypothetical protein
MGEKPLSASTHLPMTPLLLHIGGMGGVVHKRSYGKFIKPTRNQWNKQGAQSCHNAMTMR